MGLPITFHRALDIDQFTRLDQRLKKQNDMLERIAIALERFGPVLNTMAREEDTDGSAEQGGPPGYIKRFSDQEEG